jgi:hypothetical protein
LAKSANIENPISPACDVYSFAMVMWELPMCQNPFEEITSETEVSFYWTITLSQNRTHISRSANWINLLSLYGQATIIFSSFTASRTRDYCRFSWQKLNYIKCSKCVKLQPR